MSHRAWALLSCLLCACLTASCRKARERPPSAPARPEIREEFHGVISDSIRDSKPWWPEAVRARPGSPNILIILMDDVGFADLGAYGSEIHTPHMDRLAASGLRYSHFTATAVCSPSRAALLTGLNHHSAGMGWLSDMDFGFPGYRGRLSRHAVTLAEILQEHGYQTLMVGKWHLTPPEERSAAGPFDSWPTGRGFDRFWGFLAGEVSQWHPHTLVSGNEIIEPPQDGSFYLPDALTDQAIEMLRDLRAIDPERPFFLYYAPGTAHAPHHTRRADRARYAGRYDRGWDVIRRERLRRQKEMGLVPQDTRLTPNNPGVVPWADLSPDQQRMYARFQENYAAFVDNLDQNVGRLLDTLEGTGQLENTLVFLLSDNGASREVGIEGSTNALKFYYGCPATTRENLEQVDQVGDPGTHPHYPHGWMQASNTPFIHAKRTTYGGGVRVPLIVSWPGRIRDGGAIRRQFHHIDDIAPTVLEALGIPPLALYQGVAVKPMEGVSMLYSFDDGAAPDRKTEQYYEMEGDRAYYADGWKLVSHRPTEDTPFDEVKWKLYDLQHDFSETTDVAGEHPDRVAELESRWWDAAHRFHVLPLVDVALLKRATRARPLPSMARKRYEYPPGSRTIPSRSGPFLVNRSYTITTTIDRTSPGQEGVLVAQGDAYTGYALYVKDDRLHYVHHRACDTTRITSSKEIPTGHVQVRFEFEKSSVAAGIARQLLRGRTDLTPFTLLKGTGRLYVGDELVGEADLGGPLYVIWEGLDVGLDRGSPVTEDYAAPFPFEGRMGTVVYEAR